MGLDRGAHASARVRTHDIAHGRHADGATQPLGRRAQLAVDASAHHVAEALEARSDVPARREQRIARLVPTNLAHGRRGACAARGGCRLVGQFQQDVNFILLARFSVSQLRRRLKLHPEMMKFS